VPFSTTHAANRTSDHQEPATRAQKKVSAKDIPADQKSPVNIEADLMDYDHESDLYRAKGNVAIFYSGSSLRADEVELDNKIIRPERKAMLF